MKFTLHKDSKKPEEYWNGIKSLPDEIHVPSYNIQMAEFELLSILSSLHGYLTAFDILIGSNTDTQKDTDISSVLTAFQMYIHPKMPLSHYTSSEKRIIPSNQKSFQPIDPKKST